MSRIGKAALHGTLALLVLGIFAWVYADSLVARAIERGGEEALGVETTVSDVDLRFRRGAVDLSGLRIANPEGFEGKRFLEIGEATAEVAPRSLREPLVVIPRMVLDGVTLSLEGVPGRTNYGALLGHAASLRSDDDGRRFVIEELVVRGLRADLSLQGLGSTLAGTRVEVPEIVLRDVGRGNGGIGMARLIAQITREIAGAVARQRPQLAGVLVGDVGGRVEDARRSIDVLRERAVEGLRGLLGGDEP